MVMAARGGTTGVRMLIGVTLRAVLVPTGTPVTEPVCHVMASGTKLVFVERVYISSIT